ncbi:unnamed protein product [Haemonchus placei]|uniref:Polyprotein n=1 Tax=Haemonchus placei TaxID=6290 RepID=A0A0N4WEF3_HAEPC|nr:unnamed protein product [Haemonchus placei]
MDVSVAIIQLRRSDRTFLSPHDYDVVILDEPSTSYSVPKHQDVQPYPVKKRTTVGGHGVASTVIKLPSFRVTDCSASLADSVLSELAAKTRTAFRRAVAIPLWDGDGPPSSGRIAPGTVLMCAPMVPKEGIYSDWAFLLNPFSGWMKTAILYASTVLILYRMLQWTQPYFACTFVMTTSMNTSTYLVPAAMNSLHALFVAGDDIPGNHPVVVQDPKVTTEHMLIISIREAVQEAVIDLVNDVLIRGTVLGATIAVIDAAIQIPELAPEVMTVITGNITPQELSWRSIIMAI